jgi:hypothetical protein
MKFKQITPSDYPVLKKYFHRQKYRLCEYSLPSIIAWSTEAYQSYAAIDGDTLIISAEFTKKKESHYLILPISPYRDFSPEKLCDIAVKFGFKTYCFVPEDYLEQYERNRVSKLFDIKNHKGFDDYIYLTKDLVKLKGNKYSKKRNLIHQFNREYMDKGRAKVESIRPAVATECIEFLEKWCEEHDCDEEQNEELYCEKQAAINTINNMDLFELKGILIRIDGVVSAFGISSHLTESMGVLHFEKALANIKGLYQYLDTELARRLFKGYKYINKESDMSVPGLAKSKKSYYPVMIIKSYKLTLL